MAGEVWERCGSKLVWMEVVWSSRDRSPELQRSTMSGSGYCDVIKDGSAKKQIWSFCGWVIQLGS